ncbi:CDP-2,3-bis-(O-geranylgeranyl)-sn-glycerol synthase [Candidatus Bathyarchaeota archaeon]|nr:MAG: CDP-2,3-bis-(O-geranylgeranyl)-sn-glycerol synthase [Candidatus Bathyarchaeota archaeon]
MFEDIVDLNFIVTVFLIVVPAYMANGFAFIFGGGKPLNGGKVFFDGKRIFGEGKTVKGVISGMFFGTLGYFLELAFLKIFVSYPLTFYHLFLGFVVACGAIFGDLVGSFIKRRIGLPRGAPTPFLDQLDFILMALLFVYLFNCFYFVVNLTLSIVFVIVVVTPFAHLISCCIAYKLGKKKEPW